MTQAGTWGKFTSLGALWLVAGTVEMLGRPETSDWCFVNSCRRSLAGVLVERNPEP